MRLRQPLMLVKIVAERDNLPELGKSKCFRVRRGYRRLQIRERNKLVNTRLFSLLVEIECHVQVVGEFHDRSVLCRDHELSSDDQQVLVLLSHRYFEVRFR